MEDMLLYGINCAIALMDNTFGRLARVPEYDEKVEIRVLAYTDMAYLFSLASWATGYATLRYFGIAG